MYKFETAKDLLKLCHKIEEPISEIAIMYEMQFSNKERDDVWKKMKKNKKIMWEAVLNGLKRPESSAFGMSGMDADKVHEVYKKRRKTYLNRLCLRSMAYSIAIGETNSAMGRISAFPTAGGSGVIPGCLFAIKKEWKVSERKLIHALFNAAAIGLIIAENATLSAAAGGCQAEIGAATAMAASAITEIRRGTPEQCLNAAAIALKSCLGLACDPLGGLVAVPCIKRNALGTVKAFAASDLSMAGVKSFIPFDEVVYAMKNIADTMHENIRETALGGLAVTKTGLKIRKKIGLPMLKGRK